jgi:hypothetical protein
MTGFYLTVRACSAAGDSLTFHLIDFTAPSYLTAIAADPSRTVAPAA